VTRRRGGRPARNCPSGGNCRSGRDTPFSTPPTQGNFDPEANACYWIRRPADVALRGAVVLAEALGWTLRSALDPSEGPADLARVIARLGPAPVKIGQAIAARPGAVPPRFSAALATLQDRAPPFPEAEAHAVLSRELCGGAPLSSVFSSVSAKPVAAASLGQVYRAVLAVGTCRVVAVKVQRPGVARRVLLDGALLRWLALVLRRVGGLNTDLPALADAWVGGVVGELDYLKEAEAGVAFGEALRRDDLDARGGRAAAASRWSSSLPAVSSSSSTARVGAVSPLVYRQLTTRRVLVAEWIDGERLDGGVFTVPEIRALVERGIACTLGQVLDRGVFHADPHPGNLLARRVPSSGGLDLVYLDFGVMGAVDAAAREGLISSVVHLADRDWKGLAIDLVSLGLLPPADGERVRDLSSVTSGSERDVGVSRARPPSNEAIADLAEVFHRAASGGGGRTDLTQLSFGSLVGDLGRTMYKHGFALPASYLLLLRSLAVLEGLALTADEDFRVVAAAFPFVARRLLLTPSVDVDPTPAGDRARALLDQALTDPATGGFRYSRLERLITAAATGGGGGWSDSARTTVEPAGGREAPLSLLLSPRAGYLRSLLVAEAASGLDAAFRVGIDDIVDGRAAWGRGVHGDAAEAARGPLADPADRSRIESILSLAVAVSKLEGDREEGDNSSSGRIFGSAALAWAAAEVEALPPSARFEASRLPGEVAAVLASRMAARGVRAAGWADGGGEGGR